MPQEITNYFNLNPDRVVSTVETLERRIGERFPDHGLLRVASAVKEAALHARDGLDWIDRPHWVLRGVAGGLALLMLGVLVVFVVQAPGTLQDLHWSDVPGLVEALINDLIFMGLALFFLATLERRVKRRRGLKAMHELRSIAHVIDMHQLTKDPDRLMHQRLRTASSPKTQLTPFELRRYLDYCSELLSMTSKIASVYLNRLDDPEIVAAANEIEQLTTGLCRKIWQKIMLLQEMAPESVGDNSEAPTD